MGYIFERVYEDICEEYVRALFGRKSRYQVLDRPVEAGTDRLCGLDGVGLHGGRFRLLTNLATAQEIDSPVVRDLEQPRFQRRCVVERFKLSIRLKERFLNG